MPTAAARTQLLGPRTHSENVWDLSARRRAHEPHVHELPLAATLQKPILVGCIVPLWNKLDDHTADTLSANKLNNINELHRRVPLPRVALPSTTILQMPILNLRDDHNQR